MRHCSFLGSLFYLPLPFPSLPLLSRVGGLALLFLGTSLRPESGWLSGPRSHTLGAVTREMPWWGCGVGKGPRSPYTGGLYVSSCCLRPAGVSGHSGQHRPVRPQSYLAISSKPFSPILITITVNDMCLPHAEGRLVKAHKTKQK